MKQLSSVLIYLSLFMLVGSACVLFHILPSQGANPYEIFAVGFMESSVLFILGMKAGKKYLQSQSKFN